MDHLGQNLLGQFVTCILLAVTCYAQDTDVCEVIPKNQTVKLGSNVTVVFKAPFSGNCRNKFKDFDPSKVSWTLNNRKIEERYYDHNSTYAMVTIANFSLESGTVESLMYGQVLGGTIVRTYDTSSNTRRGIKPPNTPINIHCVLYSLPRLGQNTTCYWEEAGDSLDTRYSVTMEQKYKTPRHCKSQPGQNHCWLSESGSLRENITVTVTAENSAGNVSATVHFHPYEILKMDPPRGIQVEPLPTSLSVIWDKLTVCDGYEKCEVQCVEEGTNVTIVSNKTSPTKNKPIYVDDVKPCTNYSVTVRCACNTEYTGPWSEWSLRSTVRSTLNVSSVPFYLWRKVLERYKNGTRRVQLMWKGSFCNATAIEYRLSVDTRNVLNSTQDWTSVLLNAKAHEIEIAAYNNSKMLRHSFLKIPVIGKDPVRRPLATSRNGLIYVSWEAPPTAVNDYVIEWFTDATQDNMPSWEKTQDTNISFPGLSHRLYTVTITPLYEDGPGQEEILQTYAEEGAPAKVRRVNVTSADSTWLKLDWEVVRRDQCCGFVVNYTVFYRDSNGPELNVTVNHPSHQVTLRELRPSTTYKVHVRTHSAAGFNDSGFYHFSTEAYGRAFIQKLVSIAGGVILLLLSAVCLFMLWRRAMNLMVPNPQLSSMAAWSLEKSLKPSFSNNLDVDNSHCETILLCRVDGETIPLPLVDGEMDVETIQLPLVDGEMDDETIQLPLVDGEMDCETIQLCRVNGEMDRETDGERGSTPTSPTEAWFGDYSTNCGTADDAGLALSCVVCETQNQSLEASPAPCSPYLDQGPVCSCGGLLDEPQGPDLSGKMEPCPTVTTYVRVD